MGEGIVREFGMDTYTLSPFAAPPGIVTILLISYAPTQNKKLFFFFFLKKSLMAKKIKTIRYAYVCTKILSQFKCEVRGKNSECF